jgi:putative effector of murein hydrolase LrgA (UPF0299 family)
MPLLWSALHLSHHRRYGLAAYGKRLGAVVAMPLPGTVRGKLQLPCTQVLLQLLAIKALCTGIMAMIHHMLAAQLPATMSAVHQVTMLHKIPSCSQGTSVRLRLLQIHS